MASPENALYILLDYGRTGQGTTVLPPALVSAGPEAALVYQLKVQLSGQVQP